MKNNDLTELIDYSLNFKQISMILAEEKGHEKCI